MSLRIDNGERATLEYADIALSPTRYIASWLRQRGWRLPNYRQVPLNCLSVSQRTLFRTLLQIKPHKALYSMTACAPYADRRRLHASPDHQEAHLEPPPLRNYRDLHFGILNPNLCLFAAGCRCPT